MRHSHVSFRTFLMLSTVIIAAVVMERAYSDEQRTFIWHFDEGAGEVAREATGSGNDADLVRGKGLKWVKGKINGALEFSGSDNDPQRLEIPFSDDMDIMDAITMQAWVYPTTIAGDKRTIVTKASYYLQIDGSSTVSTYFYDVAPPGYHLSNGRVSENKWTHVAVTYDGKEIKFYIDGEEDKEVVKAEGKIRHRTDWSVYIGGERPKPHCCPRYFEGIIDELKVSNFAMAAEQIKEAMEGPFAVMPVGKSAARWSEIKEGR